LIAACIAIRLCLCCVFFFFFQAEDGIRDFHVTGVQTCALPISGRAAHRAPPGTERRGPMSRPAWLEPLAGRDHSLPLALAAVVKIGRASCKERGEDSVGAGAVRQGRTKSWAESTRSTAARREHR